MALPKRFPTGQRYLPSSAYNCYVTILNPNAGQAPDGTPNPPLTVASNVHANVSMWRGREMEKHDDRVGETYYKVVLRYPKTYTIDSGCQIVVKGRTMNIDSLGDPDLQQVELHMWVTETNPGS